MRKRIFLDIFDKRTSCQAISMICASYDLFQISNVKFPVFYIDALVVCTAVLAQVVVYFMLRSLPSHVKVFCTFINVSK